MTADMTVPRPGDENFSSPVIRPSVDVGGDQLERRCEALMQAAGYLMAVSACPELLATAPAGWQRRVDQVLHAVRRLAAQLEADGGDLDQPLPTAARAS